MDICKKEYIFTNIISIFSFLSFSSIFFIYVYILIDLHLFIKKIYSYIYLIFRDVNIFSIFFNFYNITDEEWEAAMKMSGEWEKRLNEIGSPIVIGSRPIIQNSKRLLIFIN